MYVHIKKSQIHNYVIQFSVASHEEELLDDVGQRWLKGCCRTDFRRYFAPVCRFEKNCYVYASISTCIKRVAVFWFLKTWKAQRLLQLHNISVYLLSWLKWHAQSVNIKNKKNVAISVSLCIACFFIYCIIWWNAMVYL